MRLDPGALRSGYLSEFHIDPDLYLSICEGLVCDSDHTYMSIAKILYECQSK